VGRFRRIINKFRAQLSTVDELAQVILKGHLEVERYLDDAFGTIFFHPEYLDRLSFTLKMNVVRAYAWNSDTRPDWQLIAKLNAVRNEIAHRGKNLSVKTADLRDVLSNMIRSDVKERVKQVSDKEVVVLAAAFCAGFLSTLTDDQLTEMRGFVESGVRDYQAQQNKSSD
jgi:hypothetical protein